MHVCMYVCMWFLTCIALPHYHIGIWTCMLASVRS
jgi:hypothetical protein